MAEKIFMLVVVLSLGLLVRARHIHPHPHSHGDGNYADNNFEDFGNEEEHAADIDGMPIDVIRNIKAQRFVPINNVFFFKKFSECEDGFKRDILGVCREVW